MTLAPRLMVITDAEHSPPPVMLQRLEPLLAGAAPGNVLVQLRDRELAIRERRSFGAALRALTREHGQLLSVNDRLDLAVVLEADAVHLPEQGVPAAQARELGRRHALSWSISEAAHAPEAAASTCADALLLAPVLSPRKGRPALGLDALRRARRLADAARPSGAGCRLYALGGVKPADVAALLDAGADGVAAIAGWLEHDAGEWLDALALR